MTEDREVADSRSTPSEAHSGPGPADVDSSAHVHQKRPFWQELTLMLGLALLLSILLKTFLIGAFWIPSVSMQPGFQVKDRIMVQKASYWRGEPQRGDIVVFKDPNNWLGSVPSVGADNAFTKILTAIGLYPEGDHLVKRVIGVSGDVIVCCDQQGRLSVNGTALNEQQYLQTPDGCHGPMPGQECSWRAGPVPDGHLFVMGDNRYSSADSSAHMCRPEETDCVPGREFVPVDSVVGKVFVLVWPFNRFHWVGRPATFDEVANRE